MSDDRPEQALENYFQDLLGGSPPEPAALVEASTLPSVSLDVELKQNTKPEPKPFLEADSVAERKKAVEKLLAQAQQALIDHEQTQTVQSSAPELKVSTETIVEPAIEVGQAPSLTIDVEDQILNDELSWLDNGRPQWAQSRFDVLLFQVSGLTLAVPLIALGKIVPFTDELTPLFGQADWFMGLLLTNQGKVRVVNTSKFVMPERYDPAFEKSCELIITINGVPWGLAVDSVNQPISLEPEDVKWRTERSKRPWLAGTVKDHMCALIDIPMMADVLDQVNVDDRQEKQ